MLLTFLLSLLFILAVCILLYAAVGLIQNKKLFTTAPKDIQAAALDHPERFYGAHVLGWKLAILALLLMIGAIGRVSESVQRPAKGRPAAHRQ